MPSGMRKSRFKVCAALVSGREFYIDCIGKTNVETLKKRLAELTGMAWFSIRLFREGVELLNTMSLGRNARLMLVFDPGFDVENVCYACLCREHQPTRNRRHKLHYWFFNAVKTGCRPCVKVLVNELGVNKDAVTDMQNWNAVDIATYFEQPEMIDFLATL